MRRYKQRNRAIKTLRNITLSLVALVLLTIASAIVVRSDAVKHRIADAVSDRLQRAANIPLQIGSVDYKFPNSITIDSLLLCDLNGDTVASVPRTAAHFDIVPFIKSGAIKIHTVTLSAPDIHLHRTDGDAPLNIQFLIDALSAGDSTESGGIPDMRISQLHIYDGRVRYDVGSEPESESFTPSHIDIGNLQMNVALRALDNDTLSIYLRRLSFDEHSGLSLKRFTANINASKERAEITRLRLTLPDGALRSDGIGIIFPDDSSGRALSFNGTLHSNRFSLHDLTPVLPQFTYMEQPLRINTEFSGTKERMEFDRLQLSTTDGTFSLDAEGGATEIHSKSPRYTLNIKSLNTTPKFITAAYMTATNGNTVPDELLRLGNIKASGTVTGAGRFADAMLSVESEAGNLTADIDMDEKGNYSGTIEAIGINIGAITDDQAWGTGSLTTTVEGNMLDSLGNTGSFNSVITPLQYRGYTYSPIRISGTYEEKRLSALVALNDSNIQVRMSMGIDAARELPRYEAKLQVDSLRPHNLGLTGLHEGNIFSFQLEADVIGNDPEHSRVKASIYDFTLKTPSEESKIRNLMLNINSLYKDKELHITSDLINGSLKGRYNYNTLPSSLKLALGRALPSLFPEEELSATDNNFVFNLNINDTKTLTKIFDLPVTVNRPSVIIGNCSDNRNRFSIYGDLNDVEYGKRKYSKITMRSNIDSTEIKMVRPPMQKDEEAVSDNDITIDIHAKAANDSLLTNIAWSNLHAPANSGNVKIDVALQRDGYGTTDITALLHEGTLTQNDTVWHLSPATITSSDDNLTIEGFSLKGDRQHLFVNGKVGKSSEDSLSINLRNIDMEYVFDLVDFHPVNLGGEVTGEIHATSLLDSLRFNSNLHIKGLTFEHGLIGDLDFNGYWDEERKAIILKGDASEENLSRTIVDGFVSPANDTLNICIDAYDTRIDFLNHLLSGFISDAAGRVSGRLYILGAMRDVNMQGTLAPKGRLRIKPINAFYNLIGDTVHISHNKIGFNDFDITDDHGNRGSVTGGVYHRSLKRFTCGFHIKADNLLAFHYPDFGEEPFYGTAFVTGNADFSTGPFGMNLSANVTTGPGSKFIYNASTSESNISNEFVTFTDRKKSVLPILNMEQFHTPSISDNINSELNLDFMLDITPDMQLRVYTNQASNDYIDIYGNGKVNAVYDDKKGFTMQGNLGLTRGTYKFTLQDIFPKVFEIRPGSTVAFNGDPFYADLNLKTVYTLPSVPLTDLSLNAERRKNVKVNCLMDITGTIFTPSLAFDLELPDANEEERELLSSATSTPEQLNMQFIYLLGIGKFYTYDYNNQDTENQSSTAMESLISNTISGQLNNMLSRIIDNGNWNFSGNFATSEKGWNSMEVEGMLSGRLLDNRLLINGNLGYRDNPLANKNFIGDFEVQWLLNKSGNVSLKAYNKTNDRYFSKTTLTTQGAGILLKREFDGWKFWQRQK